MDDTIFNAVAGNGTADTSNVFQKQEGGVWTRVRSITPDPPDEEVNSQNDCQNVDHCLPVKVMKLFGLPEPYRRLLYNTGTSFVEEVQEIKSLPSKTASTVYNMFSWICGRNEAPSNATENVEEEVKDSEISSGSLTRPGSSIKIQSKISVTDTDFAEEKKTEDTICRRLLSLPSSSGTPSRFALNSEEITTVYTCQFVKDDSKDSANSLLALTWPTTQTPVKPSLTAFTDEKKSEDSLCIRLPSLLSCTASRFSLNSEESATVHPCRLVEDGPKVPSNNILALPGPSAETTSKLSLTDFEDGKKREDSLCRRLPSLHSFTPSRFSLDTEEATAECSCPLVKSDSKVLKSATKRHSDAKLTSEKKVSFVGVEKETAHSSTQQLPPRIMELLEELKKADINDNISSLSEAAEGKKSSKDDQDHPEETLLVRKVTLYRPKIKTAVSSLSEGMEQAKNLKEKDVNQNEDKSPQSDLNQNGVTSPQSKTSITHIRRQSTFVINQKPSNVKFAKEESDSSEESTETETETTITESTSGTELDTDPAEKAIRFDYCFYCQRPTTRRQFSSLGPLPKSKSSLSKAASQPPKTAPSHTSQDPNKFKAPVYIPRRTQSQPRNNLCRKIKLLERRNHPRISCADLAYQYNGDNNKKNPVNSQQKGAKGQAGRPQWQY